MCHLFAFPEIYGKGVYNTYEQYLFEPVVSTHYKMVFLLCRLIRCCVQINEVLVQTSKKYTYMQIKTHVTEIFPNEIKDGINFGILHKLSLIHISEPTRPY